MLTLYYQGAKIINFLKKNYTKQKFIGFLLKTVLFR